MPRRFSGFASKKLVGGPPTSNKKLVGGPPKPIGGFIGGKSKGRGRGKTRGDRHRFGPAPIGLGRGFLRGN